jgi:nucleoside-diphosphate-sugar epimerase
MNSLIKTVEETVGKKISIATKPAHKADLRSTLADNTRINKLHGDDHWTSINQGIALTFDWYKQSN